MNTVFTINLDLLYMTNKDLYPERWQKSATAASLGFGNHMDSSQLCITWSTTEMVALDSGPQILSATLANLKQNRYASTCTQSKQHATCIPAKLINKTKT
jgi:hypothetical protein